MEVRAFSLSIQPVSLFGKQAFFVVKGGKKIFLLFNFVK
jgi:hypothetical protein